MVLLLGNVEGLGGNFIELSFVSGDHTITFLPISYLHPERSVFQDFSFDGFQLCIVGYFTCVACYLSVLSVLEPLKVIFSTAATCTPKRTVYAPQKDSPLWLHFPSTLFQIKKSCLGLQ